MEAIAVKASGQNQTDKRHDHHEQIGKADLCFLFLSHILLLIWKLSLLYYKSSQNGIAFTKLSKKNLLLYKVHKIPLF
jgi:hypothetical protein